MKKPKIFSHIYIILFPYILFMIIYFLFPKMKILLLALLIIFLVAVGIISCVFCNISAVAGQGDSGFNLAVKIVYIPVHILMLLLFGGMMNPFLFLASWIPVVISIGFMAFSGLCNIGNCLSLYRNKKCGLAKSVILCIIGFIYGLDIIGGIIQLICSFREKNI